MAATAIVVPFADLEPVVGDWRRAHTGDGADGMPAHVTLIYPFVDDALLGDDVVEALRKVIAEFTPFDVRFAGFGRFDAAPPVLYLAPEPARPFLVLIASIFDRFPAHPPFGGMHETIVPHLTVAHTAETGVIEAAERGVAPHLPLRARAAEVSVMAHSRDAGWHARAALPL